MNRVARFAAIAVVALACVSAAQAVVIDTVPVGNPGNDGELSGEGAGGDGPDRICGAVDYVYNIGKSEVTAGQYTEFLNAVAATDTYGLYSPTMDSSPYGCQITQNGTIGSYTYDFSGGTVEAPGSTAGDWENRPVNFVSWGSAARFCNWLHNGRPGVGAPVPQDHNSTEDGAYYLNGVTSNAELMAVVRKDDATWVIPTEDEWYKPAYHYNDGMTGNYYDYPTSSDSVPGYVNDSGNLSGTGTVFTEGGTDPGNYATYDGDAGTDGIGSPYYRTEVGEWENSDSPYATSDQAGNVFEWNEAVIGFYRGLRGGSFNYNDGFLYAATRSYGSHPASEYDNVGFRVAHLYQLGACCLPDQTCGTHLTQEECEAQGGTYAGNRTWCACWSEPPVPAVSEWGMVAMVLLVLTAGTLVWARRSTARA